MLAASLALRWWLPCLWLRLLGLRHGELLHQGGLECARVVHEGLGAVGEGVPLAHQQGDPPAPIEPVGLQLLDFPRSGSEELLPPVDVGLDVEFMAQLAEGPTELNRLQGVHQTQEAFGAPLLLLLDHYRVVLFIDRQSALSFLAELFVERVERA